MSLTATQSIRVNLGTSGSQVQGTLSDDGSALITIDQAFPAETSDTVLVVEFTVATVQQVYLLASTDTTIKTNSTGGADTISLKAGQPFSWGASAGYFANPFGTDVTSFHVTCALASHLQGFILTG